MRAGLDVMSLHAIQRLTAGLIAESANSSLTGIAGTAR